MKLDQSKWPQPTGLGDQLTQPKDEWGRDAQIYLAQIRAEKIEADVEAAVMAARVSVSTDEPITERLLQYSSNPQKVRLFSQSYYAGLRKSQTSECRRV